jgi:hypothetical protein
VDRRGAADWGGRRGAHGGRRGVCVEGGRPARIWDREQGGRRGAGLRRLAIWGAQVEMIFFVSTNPWNLDNSPLVFSRIGLRCMKRGPARNLLARPVC